MDTSINVRGSIPNLWHFPGLPKKTGHAMVSPVTPLPVLSWGRVPSSSHFLHGPESQFPHLLSEDIKNPALPAL